MFYFKIHGPRYGLVGENLQFDVSEVELPMGVSPADLVIIWHKDGSVVPQYPGENQLELDLWDVDYPTEGNYFAVATAGEYNARSNVIYLEIGTEMRNVYVRVESRHLIEASIGDVVSFAPRCITTPDYAHRECIWYHNGSSLGPDEYISVPINTDAAFGEYDLHTTAWAHGGYNPFSTVTKLEIVEKRDTIACKPIYIHNLNPGRDKGYVWIGWWVFDEIIDAVIDGFDWMADPFNSRFKYKCEIANLVDGFNKWPDLEVQESRDGYIYSKADLT